MPVYLALRDVEDRVDRVADGRPQLPEAWDCSPVETAPAPTWTAYPPGVRQAIVITRCAVSATRAVYAIRATREWLDSLDQAEVMPAREVWRRALAGETKAVRIMRAWRWWRCDVTERDEEGDPVQLDGVVRELTADDVYLPRLSTDPLPWDLDASGNETTAALAVRRVRALIRPVLAPGGVPWTMAGAGMHTATEAEPDRGE